MVEIKITERNFSVALIAPTRYSASMENTAAKVAATAWNTIPE